MGGVQKEMETHRSEKSRDQRERVHLEAEELGLQTHRVGGGGRDLGLRKECTVGGHSGALSPCCVQGCQRPRSEPSHRSLSESRPGPAPAGMLLGWTPCWGLWELREEGAHWGALGQNCLLTSETGRGPWWGQAHPSPRLWMEAVGTVRAPTSVDLRQPGPWARLGSSHHHPAWLWRQAAKWGRGLMEGDLRAKEISPCSQLSKDAQVLSGHPNPEDPACPSELGPCSRAEGAQGW